MEFRGAPKQVRKNEMLSESQLELKLKIVKCRLQQKPAQKHEEGF